LDKRASNPLIHEHINPPGRHSLVMPEAVVKGELRPLRNPDVKDLRKQQGEEASTKE
jgi:hypothetical protein